MNFERKHLDFGSHLKADYIGVTFNIVYFLNVKGNTELRLGNY